MSNTNKTLALVTKENAICIVGKGGSGKTRILEEIYREAEDNWEGNVLFIHAPSRIRESYPSFIVNERRNIEDMSEEISMLEGNFNEGVNSSKEIIGIVHTFLKNGVITRGTLIIVDSLDALMDTKDMKILLSLFNTMMNKKEIAIALSVSSILGVRAVESNLSSLDFFEVKRDEKAIMEKKEKSEEVYSFFLSLMEDL